MRTRKGFTLIELMIVIAIIAIIAAIAIPNLMQSRLRANEATAVTCVRNYGTAQVTFQLGQQSSVASNANAENSGLRGFADNFRNLFYGNPRTIPLGGGVYDADKSRNLALISQAHADAFLSNDLNNNTNSSPIGPSTTPIVYQGYYFGEDPWMLDTPKDKFVTNYAMVAVPADSSTTGNNIFWMDSENTVMRQGLPAGQNADETYSSFDGLTPLSKGARSDWSPL